MLTAADHQARPLPGDLQPGSLQWILKLAWAALIDSEPHQVHTLAQMANELSDNPPAAGWPDAAAEEIRRGMHELKYLLGYTARNLHILEALSKGRIESVHRFDTMSAPYGGFCKWQHSVPHGKSSIPLCAQIKPPSPQ